MSVFECMFNSYSLVLVLLWSLTCITLWNIIKVVLDFGSGFSKSAIRPFFGNLPKSGSGKNFQPHLLDLADTSAAAVCSFNYGWNWHGWPFKRCIHNFNKCYLDDRNTKSIAVTKILPKKWQRLKILLNFSEKISFFTGVWLQLTCILFLGFYWQL